MFGGEFILVVFHVCFVAKCFNHKETWKQDFLRCLRCLNAIHLIKISFLKAHSSLKTVMSALKYTKTRFHTSRKLNSRKNKIAFRLDVVIFLLNLFETSQYSGTEYISLVLSLCF